MSTNDQFQKLLETFGLDLQKFIKEEVKQQVALATGSVDRNKAEETKLNSSKNTTLDVTEDLKGLENILIDLKSKSAKKDTNQQVDDLISSLENFSSDNADSLSELLANASSTSASRVSNDDYLEKLMLLQKNDNNSSSDSEDSLESLLSFTKENDVDKIKEITADYYLDKLMGLENSLSQTDNSSAGAKRKTGMAYALQLLQQYKNKFSN